MFNLVGVSIKIAESKIHQIKILQKISLLLLELNIW